MNDKYYIAIDLKSFFASCECVYRKLDPNKTPLIVAGKREDSITLAVTPYLKRKGIPSRTRLYKLPVNLKYIRVLPNMKRYTDFSNKVNNVYLKYFSKEDIHFYSIDEVFIDATNYLKYYNKDIYNLTNMILTSIKKETGLSAAAGIGKNIFTAKVAMDIEGKKSKDNIANWCLNSIEKLHSIEPLSLVWGIGDKTQIKLNKLGIYNLKDLSNYDQNKIESHFGIIGLELYNYSKGIDYNTIKSYNKPSLNKSIGHSQVLHKNYYNHNIEVIIKEMINVLTKRLRDSKQKTGLISFKIRYSRHLNQSFNKSQKLETHTNNEKYIFQIIINIFNNYYEDNLPIREVSISYSNLVDDCYTQINLFSPYENSLINKKLYGTIDKIKNKYGNNTILNASSLLKDSTIKERNKKNE